MIMHDKMFEPLDVYEEELMNSIENGEWERVPMTEKDRLKIKSMAQKTLEKIALENIVSHEDAKERMKKLLRN